MIHPAKEISNSCQEDHCKGGDKKPVFIKCNPPDQKDMEHPCYEYTNGSEGKTDPNVRSTHIPDQKYGGNQQHRDER